MQEHLMFFCVRLVTLCFPQHLQPLLSNLVRSLCAARLTVLFAFRAVVSAQTVTPGPLLQILQATLIWVTEQLFPGTSCAGVCSFSLWTVKMSYQNRFLVSATRSDSAQSQGRGQRTMLGTTAASAGTATAAAAETVVAAAATAAAAAAEGDVVADREKNSIPLLQDDQVVDDAAVAPAAEATLDPATTGTPAALPTVSFQESESVCLASASTSTVKLGATRKHSIPQEERTVSPRINLGPNYVHAAGCYSANTSSQTQVCMLDSSLDLSRYFLFCVHVAEKYTWLMWFVVERHVYRSLYVVFYCLATCQSCRTRCFGESCTCKGALNIIPTIPVLIALCMRPGAPEMVRD